MFLSSPFDDGSDEDDDDDDDDDDCCEDSGFSRLAPSKAESDAGW